MHFHRINTTFASISAAAALALNAGIASADTKQITTQSPPTLLKSAFESSAHQALQGKVMGYSFLLMKDGRVVSEGAGGYARNAADGQKPMTTNTPQNLGSLFKFVTGMTMLHILEHPPAGSAGGQGSFTSRLDAPVALLYPQIWQNAVKTPAIRTITFRQLLQHKSGFRSCGAGANPIGCFSGPFDPNNIGVREYENINFSLTGFLIGVYTKPDLLKAINGVPNSVPVADRDKNFQIAAGQQMDKFFTTKMFPLVPGKISASCDALNEYKNTGAYTYRSRLDRDKGIITSRKASNLPCVGSGGYWMSIRDFAAFAATALHSNAIISSQVRSAIYNDKMDVDDRLVWSFTTSNTNIKDNFGMGTIIYSGGDQPYAGGQGAHTAIVRLPLGYEVLVFVNSNDLNSGALAKVGINAFWAGMAHNFQ